MHFARPFSLFDRLPGPPFSNDGPFFCSLSRRSQICRAAAGRGGMSAATRSEWGEAGNRFRYRRFIPPVPNLSRGSQPRRHVSGDMLGMGRSGEPLPIPAVHPAGSEFVAWQPAASACQRRHARNGEKRGTAPDTGGSSRRFRICRAAASRGGLSAAARSEWGEAGNRSRYRRFIPPEPNLSRGSQPRRIVSGDTPRRYFTLAAVLSLRTTSWAPPSMMLVAETRVSFAFS